MFWCKKQACAWGTAYWFSGELGPWIYDLNRYNLSALPLGYGCPLLCCGVALEFNVLKTYKILLVFLAAVWFMLTARLLDFAGLGEWWWEEATSRQGRKCKGVALIICYAFPTLYRGLQWWRRRVAQLPKSSYHCILVCYILLSPRWSSVIFVIAIFYSTRSLEI